MIAVVVTVAAGWAWLTSRPLDPRAGFMSVQRLILAQIIGSEPSFIVERGKEPWRAELVSPTRAHVTGWYRTRIGGPLDYQMIVDHDLRSDLYRSNCFVLVNEIAQGKAPCF